MPELSDQSLVLRCINGERPAWDEFVERFSRLVVWAIKERLRRTSLCYTQQDLQDIFQNVFILLWEKGRLRQISNRQKIASWLAMVSANCALNYFRNKRQEQLSQEGLIEKIPSSDYGIKEVLKQDEDYQLLEKYLNDLPAREIIALKLNYFYNKSHQEIAQILNLPLNSISSIIQRSKQKLKEKFKEQGNEIF